MTAVLKTATGNTVVGSNPTASAIFVGSYGYVDYAAKFG
jgi:hypothetical protein